MELQKMFIDGEWVEGSTGKSVPTLNPSNGEVLAMVTEGNVEDVDKAIAAAKRSFYVTREWRDMDSQTRADILLQIADAIDAEKEDFAKLDCMDHGRLQWPFRTLLEHEGALALGTDYPVVTIDPFTTIYAAVTRRDDDGNLTSTNPWEKISMADTLKAYTSGAARVYHVEDSMGTLEPGKMADIIVLSGDLFEVDKEEIREMKVEANYFEGEKIR